jgi:hypothetical protein
MDMRFGTWNVKDFYKAGSLAVVSKELPKCMLYLMGVQEVWWDDGGTELAGEYTFFYRKRNENHELGTGFWCIRESSAVKKVEFVSDRLSYILLRSCWCHIVFLNGHTPTADKIDYVKNSFYEELEHALEKSPKYHTKIFVGNFNAKVGKEDVYKPRIGNGSLRVITNDSWGRVANLPHLKISQSKLRRSHIAASSNILGRLQMGNPTARFTIFCKIGKGIRLYLMFDLSWQHIVILITIWWWQTLGRD